MLVSRKYAGILKCSECIIDYCVACINNEISLASGFAEMLFINNLV
jgi:hypothetical protein